MTESREVTLDGWKAAVFDEVLLRAASVLSEAGAPATEPSVSVSLVVSVLATQDGSLLVSFDSDVDGRVTTCLRQPF